MSAPYPPLRIWSRRFSIQFKAWHWESERIVSDRMAEAWLEVFRHDEPDQLFILARSEPKDLDITV